MSDGLPGLTVVGTPLGNLADLSPRATEALGAAAVIACEDTRRTGRLLAAAGITKRTLVVANEHTERDVAADLVERARRGEAVALVTDAGMPGVSDPGQVIVAAFADAGLPVVVVPGPSAVSTAVAGSGLPAGRFVFDGFLPRKGGVREERLAQIAVEERAVVLYEAPHRAERTLADLARACGDDRPVAIGRELTKLHEEWFRGTLAGARSWLADSPKGEFVLVVGGAPAPAAASDERILDELRSALATGASTRDAVADVAARLGAPKRHVYELALTIS